MKIKAVCEITKLTDRTIRYYIEEGLIYPDYTENYMGRRTFYFSESDINILNDIAVLRKYGFTVSEIKTMLEAPMSIPETIENLKIRKQKFFEEEKLLLEKINVLITEDVYNVSNLAKLLSEPVENKDMLIDKMNLKQRVSKFLRRTTVFLVVDFPIYLFIFGITLAITKVKYPVIQWHNIFFALLTISPSLIIRFASKKITKKKTKRLLLFLCAFCGIFTFCFSYCITSSASVTTSVYNYGDFYEDEYHLPISREYADLFWGAPHEFYYEYTENGTELKKDVSYYYCFDDNWNNLHGDIYGEWTVSKETLKDEILRVKDLFDIYSYSEYDKEVYEMKKGDWNCIVKNDQPWYLSYNSTAFEIDYYGYYRYYIFAYNEKELKVRYIAAYGEEYRDGQPYYMTLEW